jgi:hypothetical protein
MYERTTRREEGRRALEAKYRRREEAKAEAEALRKAEAEAEAAAEKREARNAAREEEAARRASKERAAAQRAAAVGQARRGALRYATGTLSASCHPPLSLPSYCLLAVSTLPPPPPPPPPPTRYYALQPWYRFVTQAHCKSTAAVLSHTTGRAFAALAAWRRHAEAAQQDRWQAVQDAERGADVFARRLRLRRVVTALKGNRRAAAQGAEVADLLLRRRVLWAAVACWREEREQACALRVIEGLEKDRVARGHFRR